MKAAEYANRLNSSTDNVELGKVAHEFLMEVKTICETRHIKTDLGLFSVLDEQDNKWRAMCRLVTTMNLVPDGFAILIQNHMPDVSKHWTMYHVMKQHNRAITHCKRVGDDL